MSAQLHPVFEAALAGFRPQPYQPRDYKAEAIASLRRDIGDFSDNVMAPAFADDENDVQLLQHDIFVADSDADLLAAAKALRRTYRTRAEKFASDFAESV